MVYLNGRRKDKIRISWLIKKIINYISRSNLRGSKSVMAVAAVDWVVGRSPLLTSATIAQIIHQLVGSLWSARRGEVSRARLLLMISATNATETTSSTLRRMVHLRLVVLCKVALGLLIVEVAWQVVLALSNLIRGTPTLVRGVVAWGVAGGITTVVLVAVTRRRHGHLGRIVVHPSISSVVIAARHLTTHVVIVGWRLLPPSVVAVALGLGRWSLASTLLVSRLF